MALGKKTGGRQKGTPNKENPLKGYIRSHSMAYFEPRQRMNEKTGEEFMASDFELDMAALAADDRVAAELKLLKFHMPEMKAIDMDMTVSEVGKTIEDRLTELAGEDDE
ncbi:hypothetical protein E5330_11890 [Muribaculum intestinale]|uniref:Uncharacterized protein n=2 Tax=Muribaculum intestinale TaxID=1796646 RepID=A0A4S2FRA3_9BACT|nr:hypothetical protein [Muribaculum intestinale]TGY71727.1 hypothetical protein E5333_11115 [Muribaculum intestinale]